jgi:probable F420-dependent oxidoreductase
MRWGLQIANLELPRMRDVAQAAEALGFHTLLLPDHVVWEGPERQRNPEHLAWDPMIEAAVIAEATRTVRVGHLVLCNLFRHPVITAQSLTTLDHLSGGRLVAGLGTGWTETEFRMTGIPFPEIGARLRMLDEALTCIRGLWTQEATTFAGEFYRLADATLYPRPVQRPHPPIMLGGGGKGLLRVAAKHADELNLISDVGRSGYIAMANTRKLSDEAIQEKIRFVREEAKRQGRDGAAIRISTVVFQLMLVDSPADGQAMAENVGGMLGLAPDAVRRAPLFLIGTPEECTAELRRREQTWGLSEMVFSGFGLDERTMRRLGEEVLARV